MPNRSSQDRVAFTLVELMVVIAVLGLLSGVLLPALQAAREATRRASCASNLRQLGLAILNYEAHHAELPLAFTPNWTGPELHGPCPGTSGPGSPWNGLKHHNLIAFLLPYLERQALHDAIDFDRSWGESSGTRNLETFSRVLPEVLCPTAPSVDERRGVLVHAATGIDYGAAASDYSVCIDILATPGGGGFCELVDAGVAEARDLAWLEGLMQHERATLRKVTDGVSRTFMLMETAGRPLHFLRQVQQPDAVTSGNWGNPQSYMVYGLSQDCSMTTPMNCSNWDEVYAFHPRGANFLYGDGAVRFHEESLDVELFITLFTRAAGDVADELP
ncbi:MAG: DUF1559 domain-containing protein [Planctomycetota bacterium]